MLAAISGRGASGFASRYPSRAVAASSTDRSVSLVSTHAYFGAGLAAGLVTGRRDDASAGIEKYAVRVDDGLRIRIDQARRQQRSGDVVTLGFELRREAAVQNGRLVGSEQIGKFGFMMHVHVPSWLVACSYRFRQIGLIVCG